MGTAFVDTVAWIALANSKDSLHQKAREIFDQLWADDTKFITSEFVLIELANALSSVAVRARTAQFIHSLSKASSIEIVPSSTGLFHQGLRLFENRSDKAWGLVDCTSFVLMRERKVGVAFTEDHHFAQAGFTILL